MGENATCVFENVLVATVAFACCTLWNADRLSTLFGEGEGGGDDEAEVEAPRMMEEDTSNLLISSSDAAAAPQPRRIGC